eukprot:5689497-Prymnesium_polylepis.1
MLVWPTGRAHGRSAKPAPVLHCLQTNATRCRVHDRGAACTLPGPLQRHVRRAPSHGQRAHLLKRQRQRLARQEWRGRPCQRRERCDSDAEGG